MVAIRRLSWIAGLLTLVVCLGISYATYLLADYSWNQVVNYDSPYATYDRDQEFRGRGGSSASVDTSTSPRVVLVLIDGLTLEASNTYMSTLDTVRQYGADMVAVTAEPSLSYPMWTNTLTGSPPGISGVTTNWYEGGVEVETLFDVMAPRPVIVSASEGFDMLFEVERVATSWHIEPWDDDEYVSSTIVDRALAMSEEQSSAALTFVYLPDTDHIAHEYGPESEEYAEMVRRVDQDLSRLITDLQDDRTLFVVTADHGHIDGGGHGGWEPEATRVPAVFFGPGSRFVTGDIEQSDIAPTIAAFLGNNVPAHSAGHVLEDVVNVEPDVVDRAVRTYRSLAEDYVEVIDGTPAAIGGASTYEDIDAAVADVREDRMASDRRARLPLALGLIALGLVVCLFVFAFSWRALVAALSGTATYYLVYNTMYFVVHGHRWSLSAFNTEEYLEAFFNLRMFEAAIAGVCAAIVAGIVYPMLRSEPKGPRKTYLGGWLSLGPVTILVVQATLGFQVAWFLWAWGADVTWQLPDLRMGFKYDLDLIQMTGLAVAALLAPVVTYLVGRYHPRVRRAEKQLAEELGMRAWRS